MKPDFNQMSREELKAYVLAHQDDDEAVRILFSRRNPNSKRYPMPKTEEDLKEMEEIFRRQIQGRNQNS